MSNGSSDQRKHRMRFPEKLMDALDGNTYADCIQWSRDGLSFEIINPAATEKRLLKEVFNGEKLQSFIRKIYKWGFVARPTPSGDRNAWKAFSYPSMFQRGKRELCRQMRRGGVRVEELYDVASDITLIENTMGALNNSDPKRIFSNGEEELDVLHLLPSSYFEDCSPNVLSDVDSVDQLIPPNTTPYNIDEDIGFDDDTKELLCLAFNDGFFE